jgi:hypothetical protein
MDRNYDSYIDSEFLSWILKLFVRKWRYKRFGCNLEESKYSCPPVLLFQNHEDDEKITLV